jgi:L-threonylcarbamoyladenylate synthase
VSPPPAPVLDARGDPTPATALAAAVDALRDGQVVGIPTDTVYGLAVDPWRAGASERVFAVKHRPRGVQLPVLVADEHQAGALCGDIPEAGRRLMARFWPGALTIVVGRRPGLGLDLGDNQRTVGLRCPDHPVALALCRAVGPLATTSANHHGEPPARHAAAVAALGGVGVVLDGGRCDGEPSTVVDCSAGDPQLRRAGAIPWTLIEWTLIEPRPRA